jgi:RNA methyltransferase, TrmH family
MLSKTKAKFIKSLQDKKYRHENKLFLVEGAKSTLELLSSDFTISEFYCTDKFMKEHKNELSNQRLSYSLVTENELSTISSYSNNNAALAVVQMKPQHRFNYHGNEWVIVLEHIQDPGNLGTIIRIADWYGITKIICSETTTDFYNPKVISSTMGSFARVVVYYENLYAVLKESKQPIVAAHLNGANMHRTTFPDGGYLIMGNESLGITDKLMELVSTSICIPRYGHAESLNVAVATAIICDAIRRPKK